MDEQAGWQRAELERARRELGELRPLLEETHRELLRLDVRLHDERAGAARLARRARRRLIVACLSHAPWLAWVVWGWLHG